jgi:hypothetical protein
MCNAELVLVKLKLNSAEILKDAVENFTDLYKVVLIDKANIVDGTYELNPLYFIAISDEPISDKTLSRLQFLAYIENLTYTQVDEIDNLPVYEIGTFHYSNPDEYNALMDKTLVEFRAKEVL